MNKKFPVFASLICGIAVIILCALGVWQIQRLQWKNDLQNQLDLAFTTENPPAFDSQHIKTLQKGQILRGVVSGRLDMSRAVLFHGRIQDGKPVLAIVAPLILPSSDIVFPVELGCAEHPDSTSLKSIPEKNIRVTGILRQPKWSFATPQNNPEKKEWWRMDSKELSGFWGFQNVEHAFLTAENSKDISPSLMPCPIEKELRNDHLSYAVFWFSMAFVLIIIWGIRFLKPYIKA